jgi:hypothetical protein
MSNRSDTRKWPGLGRSLLALLVLISWGIDGLVLVVSDWLVSSD